MNSNTLERERRRVSEVARDFRQRGYEVELSPSPSELPSILHNYRPDIIARSETETVVIEVRSKGTYSDMKQFAQIAEDIHSEPGWRFELVVTNPARPDTGNTIPLRQTLERLHTAQDLSESPRYTEAALLLAWSGIEPLIRSWAEVIEHSNRKRSLSPGTLAKTAYSLGIVNKKELAVLESAAAYRNSVVHGFETQVLSPLDVRSIINLGLNLANRAQESPDFSEHSSRQ